MPIPTIDIPPRTPSPTEEDDVVGLDTPRFSTSPRKPMSPAALSPFNPFPTQAEHEAALNTSAPGPFNFQPTTYTVGRPPATSQKGDLGRRRGHKYARSSVSHQIILSPAPKTPLQLPTSFPIPTLREFQASMTREQTTRWLWCFCHLAVAAFVQSGAHGSLSGTTLSHLLLFDALGAFLCVAVDSSRNFEVWNRSSISHPFGLERSEVLAGLAMSIILLFMGLDLLSHGFTHAMEESGHTHHVHPADESDHMTAGTVNIAALAAILSTMVSASMLGNHARIGRAIRFPSFLPESVRNPSHLLPVSLSLLLLFLPLLGIKMSHVFDAILGFGYAASMVVLGARLCYSVGRMLLMSYSGSGIKEVLFELETDPAISAVDEAKVWQVHYGLCMANFKLRVRQMDQADRLRERVMTLVRNRLGGGYGQGSKGVKWEVSTQITLDP